MVNTCWIRGCKNRADDDEKKRSYFIIPKIREHEGEQTKELSKERRRKWLANIKKNLNHQSTRKSALTISLEVNITVYIHRGYIMSAHVYIEFIKLDGEK